MLLHKVTWDMAELYEEINAAESPIEQSIHIRRAADHGCIQKDKIDHNSHRYDTLLCKGNYKQLEKCLVSSGLVFTTKVLRGGKCRIQQTHIRSSVSGHLGPHCV